MIYRLKRFLNQQEKVGPVAFKKIKRFLSALSLCLIALGYSATTFAQAQEKTVLSNTWAPYINSADEDPGQAAQILNIIFRRSGLDINWVYTPYEMAFYEVSRGQQLLSFPYFKTQKRQEQVLYSAPVFSVSSKVFYNRQYLSHANARSQFEQQRRIGKVAGYSYGESLDKATTTATIFNSEKRALTALFNHEIDLLPMTQSVLNSILETQFPDRKQLIRPIEGVEDVSSLHLIAANTAEGKTIIARVDQSLAQLKESGLSSLQSEPFEAAVPVDIAQLVSAEGYPTILGQTKAVQPGIEYYTLPLGTEVLVLKWSENMLRPSMNDRLYQHMMDLSKVVVLNGPHVGKELFIRNMHIELR